MNGSFLLDPSAPRTTEVDVDALEASFAAPAVEPRRTVRPAAADVLDAPRAPMPMVERIAVALFATLFVGMIALVLITTFG